MPRHLVVGRLTIAARRMSGPLAKMRSLKGALAVTLAVLIVAFLVRLSVAPISIPGAALAERMLPAPPGGTLDVGRLTLRLGAGRLHIGLLDIAIRAEGLTSSVSRLVLAQGLRGRTVQVEGPLVRLDPSAPADGPMFLPDPRAALENLDSFLETAGSALRDSGVDSVGVRDGRVEIVPKGRPIHTWRVFQDVTATLETAPDLSLALSLVGKEGRVDVSLARRAGADGSTIRAAVTGLVPKDLVALKPVEEGFAVDAALEAVLPQDGSVQAAARIAVGQGTVVFGLDPPRTLDSGRIDLTLSPDGAVVIDRAEFVAGGSRVPITGTFVPGSAPWAPWSFRLTSEDALFDPPDTDDAPVLVNRMEASGRIDLAGQRIYIDSFQGRAEEGRADAILTFDFSHGPRLSGAVRVGPAPMRVLRAVWPAAVAYGPRRAVLSTVVGGVAEKVDVNLALTPLELDGDPTTHDMIEGGMAVDAPFRDATITTPELPLAVRRAHGHFAIRDKALSARIDGGIVGVEGRELEVVRGTFEIPRLQDRPPTATLRAKVRGPLAGVIALAERLELPQLKEFDIKPEDVTGTVEADLWLETPLGEDVPMSRRRWSIDSRLTDAGASVPLAGRTVENANLEVLVNARRIAARGRAEIDGLTVDVNYSELFAGEKSGAARFVLTDEERRRRGIDTGDMLRGPVVITVEQGEDERRRFTADFTEAEIALPVFDKPAGRGMMAEGAVVEEGEAIEVQDLTLEGAGVEVAGALMIADGSLSWAALEEVALSDGDEARIAVEQAGEGYRVDIQAARFDARHVVTSLREGGASSDDEPAASPPPVALTAQAERLRLTDEAVASDVTVDAAYDGERLVRLSVSGRLDDLAEGSFAARVAPGANGARDVRGDVRELGRLLAAFGIYERMEGGRTTLEARLDQDGVVTGRVLVRDFALANETTLEAVIARARTATGLTDVRNPLPLAFQGNDGAAAIPFERLAIEFEKRGDTIFVREAILRGPVMGGTVEGEVDLAARTLALNGTFIPAYGVNNLFGRLPLFGEILGGGETGGLIGVTFRLAGPIDDPRLLLNPISAIAPGIFRRIFEFR